MKQDSEGAGKVMSSWDAGVRSSRALGARDVVAENRAAIVAGQTSAKAINAYRKNNVINIDERNARRNAKVDNFADRLRGLTFGDVKAGNRTEPPVSQLIKGGAKTRRRRRRNRKRRGKKTTRARRGRRQRKKTKKRRKRRKTKRRR